MNFLLDEDCPKGIGAILRKHGHRVLDIRDIDIGASDQNIYQRIQKESLILVTRDKGFGNLLRISAAVKCGVVLFRVPRLPIAEIIAVAQDFFSQIKPEQCLESLVVVQKGRFRVHRF